MATTAAKLETQGGSGLPAPRGRVPSTLARWERDLEGVFGDFLDDIRPLQPWSRILRPGRFLIDRPIPSTDVYEKGDEVIVRAEVPGMSKDDLEVSLTDSTLTLKGEKRHEEEVKEEDYHRCERSFGSILRTVELPSEVKADDAKATYKDGVLEVRLPKTEQAKQKSVKLAVE